MARFVTEAVGMGNAPRWPSIAAARRSAGEAR
jgi:hypothetical protein